MKHYIFSGALYTNNIVVNFLYVYFSTFLFKNIYLWLCLSATEVHDV